ADMHMRPLPDTVALLQDAGLEIRGDQALREHYAHTIADWRRALHTHHEQAVDLVGDQTVRVWQLYLAGGELAFEHGRMGVDQILATRR
ncbi:MAG: class I SAM-dependent methyltransferase, partial [Sciscionella sp.]